MGKIIENILGAIAFSFVIVFSLIMSVLPLALAIAVGLIIFKWMVN